MTTTRPIAEASPWPTIVVIVGAGVVSAFQVGKAPMALAAVQAELALDLATVSWLISAFAVIGALVGVPIGLAVDRVGAKRMAVLGLLLQGAGAALGALSAGVGALLATRLLEGLGFLCVVVAAPALITAVAPADLRDRAMALWATFMPVGLSLIMLAAPLLTLLTWRGFWLLNAVLLTGYAMLLGRRLRLSVLPAARPRPIRQAVGEAMTAPGPWVLGGLFAAFSAMFFAVFGFLPSFLAERLGIGNETASMLSAVAAAASAAGNIVCGQLLTRGFRPARLLVASFGVMAICGVGIFSPLVPGAVAFALCVTFSFISGLVPVVIFDSAPRLAPRPALIGVTIGFAMQGNNIGLIVGPAAAGGVAATFGWPMVSLVVAAIAVMAMPLVRVLADRSPALPVPGKRAGRSGQALERPPTAG